MKDYLLQLPQELHAQIKYLAAINNMTMKEYMIKAINEKVDKQFKPSGGKSEGV